MLARSLSLARSISHGGLHCTYCTVLFHCRMVSSSFSLQQRYFFFVRGRFHDVVDER